MAVSAKVIRTLAELAEDNAFIAEADADQRDFGDFETLNRLHWSSSVQRYCDFGRHSLNVTLVKHVEPGKEPWLQRKVLEPPSNRFVEDANGYVSLFPFLLRLIPADSEQLAAILKDLDNPKVRRARGYRGFRLKHSYLNVHEQNN